MASDSEGQKDRAGGGAVNDLTPPGALGGGGGEVAWIEEPTPGLEPGTPSLRVKCSTS